MITQEQIDKARERLEQKWDAEGACNSCGWHAALYEHEVEDEDIQWALEDGQGWLELGCMSEDDEHADLHRGVVIYIDD